MKRINVSSDVPDSAYFTTAAAEPTVNRDGTITILNGRGRNRSSWGAPGVTSTVIFDSPGLLAIHVGYHHKHRGGQFWRYYKLNDDIRQVTWRDLDDDTRAAILEAAQEKAPDWAKSPGKLRSQYLAARPAKASAFTAYKIVAVGEDGQFTSLYDPRIVYEIGKTKVERCQAEHNGGWYVYADRQALRRDYVAGGVVASDKRARCVAMLECECWGNRVFYDDEHGTRKIAVTYCKPLKVIEIFEVE